MASSSVRPGWFAMTDATKARSPGVRSLAVGGRAGTKAFNAGVADAQLSAEHGKVTPHILRHTAATWLMQQGVDPWVAAGYLGMTMQTLIDNYGHHHSEHLSGARRAFDHRSTVTGSYRMTRSKREQMQSNAPEIEDRPKTASA
jgi:hypothetical protein